MNKLNYPSCMSGSSYTSPECEILEIRTEGILCYSSSADMISQRDLIDFDDDYHQIF